MDHLHDINSTTVRTDDGIPAPPASPPPSIPQTPLPPSEAAWLGRDWRFTMLRGSMRLLSRVAPPLAVDLFQRTWFTPPRVRPRGDALRWLARGEPMAFRVHGHAVRAWSWGKGPTVLLVHGWGGHAGHLHAIGQALCERGLRVVAYDAPAHGQSGPSRLGARRVTLVEIADALRIVAAGAGPLHGLVAHSGGCTAAALALRGGWTGPRRMALVAPFALPSQAVAPFGRAIGASDAVTARFSARVQVWLGRPWTEFDMTGLPASRTPPPSLVVHDAGDREVPAAHGRALAGAWPGTRWLETAGLGHRRLLRDPAVVARVADFIAGGDRPRRWRPSDARDELDRLFDPHGSTPG